MIDAFLSPPVAAALRWTAFCAASILLGSAAFHAVVGTRLERAPQDRLRALVRLAGLAVLVSCAGRMAQQALAFAAAPGEAWGMVAVLLSTAWGYAWLAQVIAAGVMAVRPPLVARRPESASQTLAAWALAVAVGVAPAFQGHAIGSQEYTALAVGADIAHLGAAGLWMGVLCVMVVVGLPGQGAAGVRTMVSAFSPWALGSAATLGVTGTFASWLHVRHPSLLWGSPYGRMVLLKVALVGGVVGLGAINWRRLTPQLGTPTGVARLTRAARGELLVAAAVFLATAILVATPLPSE